MTLNILPYDFDDDLMAHALAGKGPVVRTRPFGSEAVVLGRGSDPQTEIYIPRIIADRIPVYRRKGGGCPVFLDPGNLIVSLVLPAPGIGGIRDLFHGCTQWLVQRLLNMGVAGVYKDGISDLVVRGHKIGGTCFYRTSGFAYYAAAILVNPDLDLMDRYLPHPPREPDYRRGRPHKNFVAGLNRFLSGITAQTLAKKFQAEQGSSLPDNLIAIPA